MKISICVSIHNMETTLRMCLDSLIGQTMADKEIILVNNGSTDNSQKIIDEYCINYPEIRAFAQEDRGLAQGRKTGVDNASGEYIGFVDADDRVEPEMFETMVSAAQRENAQIVECRIDAEGKFVTDYPTGVFDTKLILMEYFLNKAFYPMLWFRIYHRSLFEQPIFPELYTNNEDEFVFPCLLYRAEKLVRIPDVFYHYTVDNVNSVMQTYKTNDRAVLERHKVVIKCAEHVKKVIGSETIDSQFHEVYQSYLITIAKIILFGHYKFLGVQERLDIIEEVMGLSEKKINCIVREYNIKKCFENNLIRHIGVRATLRCFRIKRWLLRDK